MATPTTQTTKSTHTNMIHINPENISGNCYYKCDYKFDYSPLTDFTMYINTNQISILPASNPASANVKYNSQDFFLKSIALFTPSLHMFSSYKADAELILTHTSAAGKTLIVAVPIIVQEGASTMGLLDQIVKNAATMHSSDIRNASFILTNSTISRSVFDKAIPMDPFYSYKNTAAAPLIPNARSPVPADWIVFGRPSAITINQIDMNILTSILTPVSSDYYFQNFPPDATDVSSVSGSSPYANLKLYFNDSGPSKLSVSDNDIYIDCQPTNISEETVPATPASKNSPMDSPELKNVIKYILMILMVFIVLGLFYFVPTIIINAVYGDPKSKS